MSDFPWQFSHGPKPENPSLVLFNLSAQSVHNFSSANIFQCP